MAAEFDARLGLSFAVGFRATVGDGLVWPDCRKSNVTTSNMKLEKDM